MKKIDIIVTALFALAMIALAWIGSCSLDYWMLALGAIVIIIITVSMQYQEHQSKKQNQ